MSRFAGQMSRPWVGMAGSAGTASEPAADVATRADAAAAAATRGGDSATNASAISFGFAATAVLVSMFLLMAIFEHLIKPGLASRGSGSHDDDDDDGDGDGVEGSRGRHRHRHRLGRLPLARLRERDASPSPDKLSHLPKVEEAVAGVVDLTVLMPGQRYPTFLAQPAPLPLAPCPREGVLWPSHDHRRPSFVPP